MACSGDQEGLRGHEGEYESTDKEKICSVISPSCQPKFTSETRQKVYTHHIDCHSQGILNIREGLKKGIPWCASKESPNLCGYKVIQTTGGRLRPAGCYNALIQHCECR